MEEAGRAARGILLCRVPEHHERGHRDFVRETVFCVHFDDLLLFPAPSRWSVPGRMGKNRHVNTWIHVIVCGNKSWREKKCIVVYFFVGSMLKKVRSKVEASAYQNWFPRPGR